MSPGKFPPDPIEDYWEISHPVKPDPPEPFALWISFRHRGELLPMPRLRIVSVDTPKIDGTLEFRWNSPSQYPFDQVDIFLSQEGAGMLQVSCGGAICPELGDTLYLTLSPKETQLVTRKLVGFKDGGRLT
jgi:hypothetical protein